MIYGQRIRLRKVGRQDLESFTEWLNDPQVRMGITMYLPLSLEEEEDWYEQAIKRPPAERPLAIEIRSGETWRLIGSCSLFDFDWRIRSAEFGILIGDKSCWNQGYGTEATRLILKHGFETLNLNRIMLRVMTNNPGARRAYQKAGYTLEGTLRQAAFVAGEYVDLEVMSVLCQEWKPEANA